MSNGLFTSISSTRQAFVFAPFNPYPNTIGQMTRRSRGGLHVHAWTGNATQPGAGKKLVKYDAKKARTSYESMYGLFLKALEQEDVDTALTLLHLEQVPSHRLPSVDVRSLLRKEKSRTSGRSRNRSCPVQHGSHRCPGLQKV